MKRLTLSLLCVLILSASVGESHRNGGVVFAQVADRVSASTAPIDVDAVGAAKESVKPESHVADFTAQATGTITLDFGNAQTINITATQRAKLQRLLDDSNAARAAQVPAQAAQTMEQWLRAKLIETILTEIRQAEAHEQAEACQAYQALSAANQNAIKTALGGKSPCR